jgi:hypothetical protein
VEVRELKLLMIGAGVRVLPDYLWESVEPRIRTALLDMFSFKRRELGQDAVLSEVMGTIQRVDGVDYLDVDTFGGIPEKTDESGQRRVRTRDEIVNEARMLEQSQTDEPLQRVAVEAAGSDDSSIHPAQLAFLTPRVPETLILKEITA